MRRGGAGGAQRASYMGGRPQTKSNVSSAGGKQYFWIFALSIQPDRCVAGEVWAQGWGWRRHRPMTVGMTKRRGQAMRRTGLRGVLGCVYPARRCGVVGAVAHDVHELEPAC